VAWLSDFLTDAVPSADAVVGPGTASAASALLSRYCAALHTTQNFTYTKRNVAEQKSLFPFGVDEFFLTAVLKMRGPVSADVRSWLFLTLPNGEAWPVGVTKATSPSLNTINPSTAVDIVLMKCVVLVAAALKARPALVSDPRILRILLAASRAAGDVEAESRLRSAFAAAGGPTVRKSECDRAAALGH